MFSEGRKRVHWERMGYHFMQYIFFFQLKVAVRISMKKFWKFDKVSDSMQETTQRSNHLFITEIKRPRQHRDQVIKSTIRSFRSITEICQTNQLPCIIWLFVAIWIFCKLWFACGAPVAAIITKGCCGVVWWCCWLESGVGGL